MLRECGGWIMSAHAAMIAARNHLIANLLSSVGVLAVILALPKDTAPESWARLALTIGFFLFAICLLWCFTQPLDDYLAKRFAWHYEGAGAAIHHTLTLLRVNVMAIIGPLASIAMATVALMALDVLSAWPAFDLLQPFIALWQWGWFLGLMVLLVLPIARSRQFFQVVNLRHQLREQVETLRYTRRSAVDAAAERRAASETPIAVLGDGRFRAGGYDWDWPDFYKNLVLFGQPGSGKTVCVLNALLDGLIASTAASSLPAAGLILDPKGDFKDKIAKLMRRVGREHDLLVFDPDDPASFRWNPFDTTDDALEVANRFGAVFEMQRSGESEDGGFFTQQAKGFVQAALVLMRLVNPPGMIPSIPQFTSLMGNDKKLREAIAAVKARSGLSDVEARSRAAALAYLEGVWLTLSEKTLSGIIATLSNLLTPFSYPPFDQLMAGRSTLTLTDCIDRGKVLYVHFPIAKRRLMAQTVGTLLKVEYGRQVLLRERKPRPSFFFCDEFQVFFSTEKETNDADFFERSRGSNHANIIATQNRPAMFKSQDDKHSVDNLLGNCATKIFLRNTDPETNQWGSDLFGQQIETLVSTSRIAGTADPRQSGASTSVGAQASYAPVVRPEEFIRLAQPGHGIDYAEAIIHFAARAVVMRLLLRWRIHPL
jgi:type IV secretory pathway TraG/TraD family ATPase VirD4